MLMLPLFVLLALAAALGAGLWLSALTVRYRDFRHVIPFIAQFGSVSLARRVHQRCRPRRVARCSIRSIRWSA